MKKILILLASVLTIYGCAKKTNTPNPAPGTPSQPNTPNNPSGNYWSYFIPNWYDNDTLIGYVQDSLSNANGIFWDTVYTKSVKDTSYIIHNGKQFYVWTEQWLPNDTFKKDYDTYFNVIVNDRLDTINATSNSVLNAASPYRHKDKMGNWSYNQQSLMLIDQDPKYDRFKAFNGYYQSRKQKY